ncbi:hypothetical protein LshimejAT787_1602740 [Lyophyllum shimeji]|uniref:Uncharacterized protein n=1 Tax=Lyophyllum shimeji TaxID=47721 RepID=A0A9P3PZA2_LYOSH|nr:hypothetical protein LshimejAT787_1602740 [Lyophyllum shimeji]
MGDAHLCNVLSRSPHLISLIRELYALDAGWVVDSASFHSLLTLLASHGMLEVFHFGFSYPGLNWVEFNGEAIRALLRSPNLHTLALEGVLTCTFQYNLLATAPALRHLSWKGHHTITEFSLDHTDRTGPRPPSPPFIEASHLKSLAMTNNSQVLLEYLTSPGCPSALRSHATSKYREEIPNMIPIAEEITNSAGQTLERLHWGFPDSFDPVSELDLRRCTC